MIITALSLNILLLLNFVRMEWEVMFMCNSLGVLLLFLIAMIHVVGVDAEKNSTIIEFKQEWPRAIFIN